MTKSNNILVTGGAGYIGSHTCKKLRSRGFVPIVVDNLSSGHKNFAKWGDFIHCDIQNTPKLIEIMNVYRPEAVIHFAAHAYVGESVKNPSKYYNNNVSGTLSLLDAMRIANVHNIIFSSTCATYGVPEKIPITEQMPQQPINAYGRSKLMIERILDDYSNAYDMHYISLRYFNAAGADPDAEIGEKHDPETHLIPLILDAASGIRKSISIYGTDYTTRDGTCIRDYIHVMDLAEAHVLAIKKLKDSQQSDIFNLGNGMGFSVKEVIESVKSVTGKTFDVLYEDRRPGDPPILVGDAGKAKSKLGWEPTFSSLDTIIQTAWNWHSK